MKSIVYIGPDNHQLQAVQDNIQGQGIGVCVCRSMDDANSVLRSECFDAAVIASEDNFGDISPAEITRLYVDAIHKLSPALSILLFFQDDPGDKLLRSLNGFVFDVLVPATHPAKFLRRIQRACERTALMQMNSILHNRLTGVNMGIERARDVRRYLKHTWHKDRPFLDPEMKIGSFEMPLEGLGGDFLGYFQMPNDKVAVFLGDAAGHDAAAAAISDFLQHELELLYVAKRYELLCDPSAILTHLSNLIYPGRRIYASMVYLLINEATDQVFWSSAGHPPFIGATADHRTDLYFSTSCVLGMDPHPTYTNREINLRHYTHLTLYSDGLVESRVNLEDTQAGIGGPISGFDMEALKNFHQYAVHDPNAFAQMIYRKSMEANGGMPQSDDVAVLVIRSGVQFEERPLPTALPPLPSRRTALQAPGLTINTANIGAEVGYDQDRYIAVIHGRADMCIANALAARVEDAVVHGQISNLIIDCMDITLIDSTFMGTLQEFCELCQKHDVELRISMARKAFINNIKEMYLNDILSHIFPHSFQWQAQLTPLQRMEDRSSREMAEHLLRAHEILSGLSDENKDRFANVIGALKKEIGGLGK